MCTHLKRGLKMEKIIQDLIKKRINETRSLNIDDYNKIVSLYSENTNLGEYIKEVKFRDSLSGYIQNLQQIAQYNPAAKTIEISREGLQRQTDGLAKQLECKFDINDFIKYISLQGAQFFFHELEHVFQEQKINEPDNSIESKLLRATELDLPYLLDQAIAECEKNGTSIDKFMNAKRDSFIECYKKNYDIILRERLAQLRSIKRIRKTIKNLDINPTIATIFANQEINEKKKGYVLNGYYSVGPTLEYMDKLAYSKLIIPTNSEYYDENKVKAFVELKQKLSTEERIEYGLPISLQEYNNIEEEVTKTLLKKSI